MDLLTSNVDLGGSMLDKRELELRNKLNWRNWSEMLTILFVANSAFAPKVFPKIQFDFPSDDVEYFGDHHLTHFHSGVIQNEDPQLTEKRTLFRQKIRQKPKLGHYCALKRTLKLVKHEILNLFKEGNDKPLARVEHLIPHDDTFQSLPALTHDRVFKLLAKDIFDNGVWSNFTSWDKNGRVGIFVVDFFLVGFWWRFICLDFNTCAKIEMEERCAS